LNRLGVRDTATLIVYEYRKVEVLPITDISFAKWIWRRREMDYNKHKNIHEMF